MEHTGWPIIFSRAAQDQKPTIHFEMHQPSPLLIETSWARTIADSHEGSVMGSP